MRALAPIAVAGLTLLLSACQSLPDKPVESPLTTTANQQAAAKVVNWKIQGKLGLALGKRRYSVAVNEWQQAADWTDIHLSSVLASMGSIRIQGNDRQLSLSRSGQATHTSTKPDALLAKELGAPLPLRHLRYWVKGIPDPDAPHEWQAPLADESVFHQSGWQVYSGRAEKQDAPDGSSLWLPGRVDMIKDKNRIRLIINQWTLSQ